MNHKKGIKTYEHNTNESSGTNACSRDRGDYGRKGYDTVTTIERVVLAVGVVSLLVATTAQIAIASNNNYEQRLQQTKVLCDKAHAEISGKSERACGLAQEDTNTEYICNNAGNCWLEVK